MHNLTPTDMDPSVERVWKEQREGERGEEDAGSEGFSSHSPFQLSSRPLSLLLSLCAFLFLNITAFFFIVMRVKHKMKI